MEMTSLTAPTLSETTAALGLIFSLLVPCAAAGLALINTGLGRARSAAHAMLSTLCVLALATLVYFTVGFAWQGYTGRQEHTWILNGKPWGWIGSERFLLRG